MLNWKNTVLALSMAGIAMSPALAEETAKKSAANQAAESTARDSATQVMEDALQALKETDAAIKALADNKNDEAIAAIERAVGKLEVTLTHNPDLALVPVDVQTTVLDSAMTPEQINATKRAALRLMKNHQLQQARMLITPLASEVDIDVTYIPLGTYPLALKSAAALIKDDKVEDAKTVLGNALATLVVLQEVQPLPTLRATALIADAAELSEKADRTDEENARLVKLLDALDAEIALGKALEYGTKDVFEAFEDQMKDIRKKTENGGSGEGFFTRLKEMFGGLSSGPKDVVRR
jgi:hypothetical protein